MKKVAVFFAIILFLFCVDSCDFLRRVAGRPTSEEIRLRSTFVNAHKTSLPDSTRMPETKSGEAESKQLDSLDAKRRTDSLGVKLSSVFRFGTPVKELEHKYNLIVGVFRQRTTATRYFNSYVSNGFSPSFIEFPTGETALCLGSSDALSDVADIIVEGRRKGLCPSDAWIYCKR